MEIDNMKEVFIKEDPFQLNKKMETIQQIKFEWFKRYAKAGDVVAEYRSLIQSALVYNYSEAIEGTKKNASMETLEAFVCTIEKPKTSEEFIFCDMKIVWKKYVRAKEELSTASRVLTTLEADLSALQTRCRIFEK